MGQETGEERGLVYQDQQESSQRKMTRDVTKQLLCRQTQQVIPCSRRQERQTRGAWQQIRERDFDPQRDSRRVQKHCREEEKDQVKMGRGERKGERILSGEKLEMDVAEVCREWKGRELRN